MTQIPTRPDPPAVTNPKRKTSRAGRILIGVGIAVFLTAGAAAVRGSSNTSTTSTGASVPQLDERVCGIARDIAGSASTDGYEISLSRWQDLYNGYGKDRADQSPTLYMGVLDMTQSMVASDIPGVKNAANLIDSTCSREGF